MAVYCFKIVFFVREPIKSACYGGKAPAYISPRHADKRPTFYFVMEHLMGVESYDS